MTMNYQFIVCWYLVNVYGDPEGTLVVFAEDADKARALATKEIQERFPRITVKNAIRFSSVKESK